MPNVLFHDGFPISNEKNECIPRVTDEKLREQGHPSHLQKGSFFASLFADASP
jgi:hypothetical protein